MKVVFIFTFSILAALSFFSCDSMDQPTDFESYEQRTQRADYGDYNIRFPWMGIKDIKVTTIEYTSIETKKDPIPLDMEIFYPGDFDFSRKVPALIMPVVKRETMYGDMVDRAVMFASFGIPVIAVNYLQISKQMIADNYSDALAFLIKNGKTLGIDSSNLAIFDAGGEVLITTEALSKIDPQLTDNIKYGLFFYGTIGKKNLETFPSHIKTVFYSGELIKKLNLEIEEVVTELSERGSDSKLITLAGRNYMFEYNNADDEIKEVLTDMIMEMKREIE